MIGKNLFSKKGKESQRSMPMCYVLWLVQNVSSYGLDGKMSKRPSHIFMSQVILGSGQLRAYFDEQEFPAPSFKHKEDRTVDGIYYPATVPLQAADFLAYEIFLMKKIFPCQKWGFPLSGARCVKDISNGGNLSTYLKPQKIYSGDRLKELEKTFDFPKGEWYLETISNNGYPCFPLIVGGNWGLVVYVARQSSNLVLFEQGGIARAKAFPMPQVRAVW